MAESRELTTDEAERLIEAVREHPCLYNTRLLEYRDIGRKENAWEAVRATCMFQTTEETKKHWKRLRDRYVRELRVSDESTRSGSGPIRKKQQWQFLAHMEFYRDCLRPRKMTSNVQLLSAADEDVALQSSTPQVIFDSMMQSERVDGNQSDDDAVNGDDNDAPWPQPNTPVNSRGQESPYHANEQLPARPANASFSKKRKEPDIVERELLNQLQVKMSENEAFCYSVARTLDRWDSLISARFKADVMQLIVKYEEENLQLT
ncbi:uncharacterized protein LOC135401182 [Ornithodoros turicata]|uniref:uncharacterized protein LOC135401182 n=1 Tax=Ornithodoros turicata TaxID=34597 RepID=UPI003138AFF8